VFRSRRQSAYLYSGTNKQQPREKKTQYRPEHTTRQISISKQLFYDRMSAWTRGSRREKKIKQSNGDMNALKEIKFMAGP
jgi:hypothetical protein